MTQTSGLTSDRSRSVAAASEEMRAMNLCQLSDRLEQITVQFKIGAA